MDYRLKDKLIDNNGRFVILYCEIQGAEYLLINVYVPNVESQQVSFFTHIEECISSFDLSQNVRYIWGGDFNCHLTDMDADGGRCIRKRRSVSKIEAIIDEYDLCDIWRVQNPKIHRFTWRATNPLIQRRLDYFLISNSLQFYVLSTEIHSAISTDHSAIILSISDNISDGKPGPSHWRLNTSLLEDTEYVNYIKSNLKIWKNEYSGENPKNCWEYLKFKIREYSIGYSKRKAKLFKTELKELEKEVDHCEKSLKSHSDDIDVLNNYNISKSKLEKYYDKILQGSIIRSKSKWHEEGEKNNKYFLNLEHNNKIKSTIRKLKDNGSIVTDQSEIMSKLKEYFMEKYRKQVQVRPNECLNFLKQVDTPCLSEEDATMVDRPITKKDIEEILRKMENNKSPGNDGIPKEFYLLFLDYIADYLIECYNTSLEEGELTASQRQAVITLVQKPGKDISLIKSWRPISLLNVDVKILSKILANRIQSMLYKIIGPEQNAFVPKRYIGDTVRLITDILYETDKQKIPGILFGADFAAAFDSVDHIFMFEVLKKYGFSEKFIKWVQILHTNIESSVTNNGYTTGYFQIERGTRQGDPLAPYLFIIVIEVLVNMVKQNYKIKGIIINKTEFKQCLFADDATFFIHDLVSLNELKKQFLHFQIIVHWKLIMKNQR